MVILITGAGGFVGRYLIKELRASAYKKEKIFGLEVEAITNHAAGQLDGTTQIDITDYRALREYLTTVKPDTIFHLAAQSSVAVSLKEPIETFRVNQTGTLNLLEISAKDLDKHPLILLVGSADLYKNLPNGESISEETGFNPLNPYAASKAVVDFLGKIYWKSYGLKIIRTRSFNHIGPEQSITFAMPNFAQQVARIEKGLQEPTLSVGNLNVRRDFTDVRDVVKAYRFLVEKGQPGEVYNVCSNHAYSLNDMLQMLLRLSGCSIEVRQDPVRMRPADNPAQQGDNSKLCTQTGWKPEIPIEKTIEDLLNYWREIVETEHD